MMRHEYDAWHVDATEVLAALAALGYRFRWLPLKTASPLKGYVAVERGGGLDGVMFKSAPELKAFKMGWMAARMVAGGG